MVLFYRDKCFHLHRLFWGMDRHITSWYSHRLGKEMPVATYGHYGFALLLVPTAGADFLEYERFGLIGALQPQIEGGRMKVFSVNSINPESWMDYGAEGRHKIIRHRQWNEYIFEEVVPFIRTHTSPETPILICGASFGALHSANLFLQRPDLLSGVIAMSGVYDLTEYSRGYWDEDVYFNSPQHYVPNLTDHPTLERIRQGRIHIFTASGPYEAPDAARSFAGILYNKGIPYTLDVWGEEWRHDWPVWRHFLPNFIASQEIS